MLVVGMPSTSSSPSSASSQMTTTTTRPRRVGRQDAAAEKNAPRSNSPRNRSSRTFGSFVLLAACLWALPKAEGCAAQYAKELRYLDLYLGVQPLDGGALPVQEASAMPPNIPMTAATGHWASSAADLDCDWTSPCRWRNAPSDRLLDTSDYFHFVKSDDKPFPIQIQPGNPRPPKGTHFALAGNTTGVAQAAVLVSDPIYCQHNYGNFTFNYWLHNLAKVEVLLLSAISRRQRLQVVARVTSNCQFASTQHVCRVLIPPQERPFRLGIRAHSLRDETVGSFVMIANVRYHAQLCTQFPQPSLFGGQSMPAIRRGGVALKSLSELNCTDWDAATCGAGGWYNAWATESEWKIAQHALGWTNAMAAPPHEPTPSGRFAFLMVDASTPRPYGVLRSAEILCTSQVTTLSFRYWLRAGTQVEVCAVEASGGVALSCAYLQEDDVPGPIALDLDAYDKPFRYTVEVIAFDETSYGVVAIDDIHASGRLCHETPPPLATTVDPLTIGSLFSLRQAVWTDDVSQQLDYSTSLDCDWTQADCAQWTSDDGLLAYGKIPESAAIAGVFPLPPQIKGRAGVLVLGGRGVATVRSREVPCARQATVTLTYFVTEKARIQMCARSTCITNRAKAGKMTLELSSRSPFEVEIRMTAQAAAVALLSRIETSGELCPLRTPQQILCEHVNCHFDGDLCGYQPVVTRDDDARLRLDPDNGGLWVVLDERSHRAVLSSRRFDVLSPARLRIRATVPSWGARLYLCAHESAASQQPPSDEDNAEACHLLIGPRDGRAEPRALDAAVDPSVHRFSLLFRHDMAAQFGAARLTLHSIELITDDGRQPLCIPVDEDEDLGGEGAETERREETTVFEDGN